MKENLKGLQYICNFMLIKDLKEFIKGVGEQAYKTLVSTDEDREVILDGDIDCTPDIIIDEYDSSILRDEVIANN